MEYLLALTTFGILVSWFSLMFKPKDRLPKGRRFKHKYGKFTATIIVDESIPLKKGYFNYNNKKINGKELAKACATGMHITSWLWDAYEFPKSRNSDSTVYECVFVFLNKEAFVEACEAVGHHPDKIAAFAIKYTKENPYDGPYGCVIRAGELKNSEIWASTPIHEYIHALSHHYTNDWDAAHKYWINPYLDDEEKTLALRAAEQNYIILNID